MRNRLYIYEIISTNYKTKDKKYQEKDVDL